MNEEFIKQLANHYKVSEETVKADYTESYKFVSEMFPSISDPQKVERTLKQLTLKYKPSTMSSAEGFNGIVVGIGSARDSMSYFRDMQMKVYLAAKEEAERSGDKSALESMTTYNPDGEEGKVVSIDAEGNITPLWPMYTSKGNKVVSAGKPISSKEESMERLVIGVAYPDNGNPETDSKAFYLNLKGNAINRLPPIGVPLSFKGTRRKGNDDVYNLVSTTTDFLTTDDAYFNEGIEKVGIDGIVRRYLSKHLVAFPKVAAWVKSFRNNPSERPIPEEFRQFVIVDKSLCVSQNFDVDAKGMISLNVCSQNPLIGEEDITIISKGIPHVGDYMDFTQLSGCVVIGRLNIFASNRDEEDNSTMAYMELYGAFGEKGYTIPRNRDAKPISAPIESTTEVKEKPWA